MQHTKDVILFDTAMHHVARIHRILCSPRGNALLVGTGGSGKRTVATLAAKVSGFHVFQVISSSAVIARDNVAVDISNGWL